MSIIPLKEVFDYGFVRKSICAFNFVNLEQLYGIINAAEELNKPVVIMISQKTATKYGIEEMFSIAKPKANKSAIPIVIHLDHAKSIELATYAIKLGFSSIMFDGSYLPFEENIKTTSQLVTFAHKSGIPVEAEINAIYGKEEDPQGLTSDYTRLEDAIKFVNETNVDFFAASIGTKHGVYEGSPNINFSLIKEILSSISAKLVMHGCSGIGQNELIYASECGICKFNFGTELMITQIKSLKKSIQNNVKPDIRPVMDATINDIKLYIKNIVDLLTR